jgi:aminopeptidase N
MKKLAVLFVFVVLLFSACKQQKQAETTPIEKGVSKSLNDTRKESIGNILYTLILNIPENKNETIKGGGQIDFQLKKNEQPLLLDFDAPESNILRVVVNGKEGAYHFVKGHIVLPVDALKVGANQIKIDFVVNDKALNRTDTYLYASFFPNKASTVFPCFDQPNLKALFSLNLMLPHGWTAIGNAPERSADEGPALTLHQFENTKPISTYKFAFAAGIFEKVSKEKNKRSVNIYCLPEASDRLSKNETYLFDLQHNALEWMEAYTKIAFPFQKIDLLLLPALQENNVAQAGLVYLPENIMLVDGNPSPEQDLKRARSIASATAQMWFGNLLSPAWISDSWVDIVLADYLSSKMVNPSFYSIYHDLEFLTGHFPKALAVDRTDGTHPIQQECEKIADADLLFDPIVTDKAPILFRQFEKIVTEEKMRTGLIDYLRKYSFSNAGWDDLVAILDSNTHDDLQRWSDIWFKKSGMPEYKAFQEYDLYVIDQFDQFDREIVWPQRLYLYKKWLGGWQNKEVWDDTARFEFPIPDIVDIVIINWDGYAYGYFFQNEREKNFLLSKRMFELDPMRRGLSYITLWENLVRGNLLPLDMRQALPLFLNKENQIASTRLLLSYYEKMFWRYSNEKLRTRWAMTMEPVLWEKMLHAKTAEEKMAFFKTFSRTAISRDGIDKMLALWRGEIKGFDLKLSEEDKTALAFELAVRKGLPAAENIPATILEQQKQATKDAGLRERIDFVSPALSENKGVRNQLFENLKSPDNQINEDFAIEAVRYLHHPLRAHSAGKFVLPSLEMLDEIREDGGLLYTDRWLAATFFGHRTASVLETAHQFIAAHPDLNPKLKQKVLQAIDPVQRAVDLEMEFEAGN